MSHAITLRPGVMLGAALGVALAVGLLASAVPAQTPGTTKIPLTREQATAEIKSPDLELRRRAAAWLGELGGMGDAPLLLEALGDDDEVVRLLAENSVWEVWSRSGDPDADSLLQVGIEQMTQGDGAAAVETFSKVIQKKPEFAEAWNKRATVYFLMGENQKSLKDCDEVIKRNPSHFGALAGYGQIYLRLDQPEQALAYFRRALRINPNMTGVQRIIPELEQLLTQRRKGTI